MMSDRVGDFIIRLQNASAVGQRSVSLPHSRHLEAIARKLKEFGFLASVAVESKEGVEAKKTLVVAPAYRDRGVPKIRGVKRLSKPGRRLYVGHAGAHAVASGTGVRLLSTPSGVLSDREARRSKVGGESLFEIW
ncbi:30S ribosomal protein S8 [Candidatus Kaiserbacteria bacterium]|nr:30S ribosomal protein S8 [Candidatus Kaiserbacteria bacterium]